jgi:transforming growth factor-beta-induced protein
MSHVQEKEKDVRFSTGIWLTVLALTTSFSTLADHHSHQGNVAANIVDTAEGAGQFTTLLTAAKAAGLVSALQGEGPLTVFAPTDDAFGMLPAGTIESLLRPDSREQLADILKFHVVSGRVGSKALADGVSVSTLAGVQATVTATEGGFGIEGARIVTTDINASNGLVHVIDRVMMPSARMTRSQASAVINMAITQGAPMFNHGNPGGTVAVSSMSARSLLRSGAELNDTERTRLNHGLKAAMQSDNSEDGAWHLRYALDDVQASLMR